MKIITRPVTAAARGRDMTLVWGVHDFPTGKIMLALSAEGVCAIGLGCRDDYLRKHFPKANLVEDPKVTERAARELARLWPHKMDRFSYPLVLYGTPFQIKVWKALLKIKSGTTVSYGDIARKIGAPAAVRAVGSAVGRNHLSILVPCHRVVNRQSRIVNYGWGPALKKALLKGEGILL
jgi:O-6-methylguanine DNA methyltransferase